MITSDPGIQDARSIRVCKCFNRRRGIKAKRLLKIFSPHLLFIFSKQNAVVVVVVDDVVVVDVVIRG